MLVTMIGEALATFDEFHHLNVDGTINQETLQLMSKGGCGVMDYPVSDYRVRREKWNESTMKYYFPLATEEKKEIARAPFILRRTLI